MLHPKLKRFIENKDGTFLVVGAPGTGKTHVLLELVSYLITEKDIPPDRILVFSFNRRWAKILREKTSQVSAKSLIEIPITSFFAYSAELIEKSLYLKNPVSGSSLPGLNVFAENEETQYSGLKILTAPDQWKLLKDVISGKLDKKNYPKTFKFMEGNAYIYRSYIQEVFDFILRAQENLLTPQVLSNKFTPFYNQVLSEIVGIYFNYLKYLKNNDLYNYGRLLVDAAAELQSNMEFAGFCKKSYEFVIVDEFQEVNRAQFEIVKNISNNNAIFFGNDDECTYAFRGSMLNNFNSVFNASISHSLSSSVYGDIPVISGITNTVNAPPAAGLRKSLTDLYARSILPVSNQAKFKNILFLDKNYRSSYLINEACQRFIKLNADRIDKKSQMPVSADIKEGVFETNEFKTVMDEIAFISSRIKKLIFLKNIKPEKICIIVKGMSYKTRLLEHILSNNNIPFMRRSSRTILENPFVKYILDFLKFIVLQDPGSKNRTYDELQLLQALLYSEHIGLSPVFVKKIFRRVYPGLRLDFAAEESTKNIIAADRNPVKLNMADISMADINTADTNIADSLADGSRLLENLRQFLKNSDRFIKSGNQKKSKKTGKPVPVPENLYLKDLGRLSGFVAALEKYIELNLQGAAVGKLIDKLVNDPDIGILKYLLRRKKNPEYVTVNTLSLLGDYLRTVNDFSESNPMSNTAQDYLIFLEDIISNNFLEEIEESTKEFLKPGFINILSYHQCKGLEFDAVFTPFINENYLPSVFGKSQLYDMQIFNYFTEGKSYPEEILKKKHLADERKLFYTGLSRAKDYVFITSSSSEPKSRFFEELEGITEDIKKKNPYKSLKTAKKSDKSKTAQAEKTGCKDMIRREYKNSRLMSLEKWLVRKRAVSKIFKNNSRVPAVNDSLLKDLIYLKEMYPPQSWWGIKKLSSNSNLPSRFISPVFSYTALSSYMECPVKYKMNFYFKLKQKKTLSLLVGNIYHEVVKNFFENNKNNLSWPILEKEISNVFRLEKYRTFEFSYLKKEVFKKTVEDFRNYYESFVSGNVLNVVSERAFHFDVGGSRIKGRIDQINFIDEGSIELIDFKSGKKNTASISDENEIQLRLYRMAVDLSPELDDLKGKEYGMKYIFLGEKKNQEVRLDKDFYDYGHFYNFIKRTIKEIKKERFHKGPKNPFTCKNCEYRIICGFWQ